MDRYVHFIALLHWLGGFNENTRLRCQNSDIEHPYTPYTRRESCPGDNHVFKGSWNPIFQSIQLTLLDAASKLDALETSHLGDRRIYSVTEAIIWAKLLKLTFAADAGIVAAQDRPPGVKYRSKIQLLFRQAKKTRYGAMASSSITNFLESSVFRKQPKVIRRGSKAAAEEAATAEAASSLVNLFKREAYGYDASFSYFLPSRRPRRAHAYRLRCRCASRQVAAPARPPQ